MTEIQDFFLSLLDYNQETGDLTWKHRPPVNKGNRIFNALYAGKKGGSIVTSDNSKTSYLQTVVKGKTYKNHRIIFAIVAGYMPEQVDHIDHNGLNNRWSNLRASNNRDNAKNLPMLKSNKSGCIGVNWHKAAKRWQARAVDKDGKRIDLGRFDNIEDAIRVRKAYEKEFGYYEHRGDVQC